MLSDGTQTFTVAGSALGCKANLCSFFELFLSLWRVFGLISYKSQESQSNTIMSPSPKASEFYNKGSQTLTVSFDLKLIF